MLNDRAHVLSDEIKASFGSKNGNHQPSDCQTLAIEEAIQRFLIASGADLDDPHLVETPRRAAKAYARELLSGYRTNVLDVFKSFEEPTAEVVLVRSIPFYSLCAHHILPFFGTASVAYKPDGRVLGLSKVGRLIECYARRLQIQERLTNQVADALQVYLAPKAAVVMLRAEHMCMSMRGVRHIGAETITYATRGESQTALAECHRIMQASLRESLGRTYERTGYRGKRH